MMIYSIIKVIISVSSEGRCDMMYISNNKKALDVLPSKTFRDYQALEAPPTCIRGRPDMGGYKN